MRRSKQLPQNAPKPILAESNVVFWVWNRIINRAKLEWGVGLSRIVSCIHLGRASQFSSTTMLVPRACLLLLLDTIKNIQRPPRPKSRTTAAMAHSIAGLRVTTENPIRYALVGCN